MGRHIGPIEFPQREAVEPFRSDPDGSAVLLAILDGDPRTYAAWASEYYECDVDLAAVEKIYGHEPRDEETVHTSASDRDFEEIAESARALGYPVAGEE